MTALLALLGCSDEAPGRPAVDAPTVTSPVPPAPTTATEDPFTAFEPTVTLVVDGHVVPAGQTLDVGSTNVGMPAVTTLLTLSNPTSAAIGFDGDWDPSDPRLDWLEPPPDSLAAGDSVVLALVLAPTAQGAVAGTVTVPVSGAPLSWLVAGDVVGPPTLMAIGRMGRVALSDDYGASFFSDTQVGVSGVDDEWTYPLQATHLAWGAGRFVRAGHEDWTPVLQTSVDGATWEDETVPPGLRAVAGITFGGDRFVVNDGNHLAWSTDGTHWNLGDESGGWQGISSMAYGNGVFVGVGRERRMRSVDGATWDLDEYGHDWLESVTFGEGLFVAVGWRGLVATSPDGITWTDRRFGDADRYHVAYGNGRFVSGGWPDRQVVSEDGVTFTMEDGNLSTGAVAFLHDAFYTDAWPNSIWRSADGVTWEEVAETRYDRSGVTAFAMAGPLVP